MNFARSLVPFIAPQMQLPVAPMVLDSLFRRSLFEGADIAALEREIADYVGVRHAICFSSARYGLYLLYRFFQCQNKSVWLPAYTCIPAADALRWAGAKPFFLDISADDYNPLFPTEPPPPEYCGAICLSYLYGLVGDIQPFLDFARSNHIPVIEDAAIALGAEYRGKKVGSLGDAGVFSLQSSKIITAWRGGVVTTNRDDVANFLRAEQKRGRFPSLAKVLFNVILTRTRRLLSISATYGWTLHLAKRLVLSDTWQPLAQRLLDQNPAEALTGQGPESPGAADRTRFTNLQARLTRRALEHIEAILAVRRASAARYREAFSTLPGVVCPSEADGIQNTYGRFPIRLPGRSKADLEKMFLDAGIEIGLYYPYVIPDTPSFLQEPADEYDVPNARRASMETVLLPMHTGLRGPDVDKVIATVLKIAELSQRSEGLPSTSQEH